MADDLEDLRARVAAAREKLTHDVDFAQKVELRLNDLARIVEGSLARQSAELDAAQTRIAVLDEDLARALARAEQAAGDASRADRLAKENGDLRSMVMTLLEVIEGRQKSSLASVMQQLEENVSAIVSAPAIAPASLPPTEESLVEESLAEESPVEQLQAEEPVTEEPMAEEPAASVLDDMTVEEMPIEETPDEEAVPEEMLAEKTPAEEAAWETPLTEGGPETAPDLAIEDEIELEMMPETEPATEPATEEDAAKEPAPMEDLSEIALYDASEEVVEPGKA